MAGKGDPSLGPHLTRFCRAEVSKCFDIQITEKLFKIKQLLIADTI